MPVGLRGWQAIKTDRASRLYVSDTGNNRVTIYDVAAITDGENAVNVLGQVNYTTGGSGITQGRVYSPRGVLIAASASASTINIAYDYDPLRAAPRAQ